MWILFFLFLGFSAEQLTRRQILAKHFHLNKTQSGSAKESDLLANSLISKLPDIIGLCIFFGTAYSTFFLFEQTSSPTAKLSFLAILIAVGLIRLLSILLRIFLSPAVAEFRLVPLTCETARTVYRLVIWTMSYMITTMMFSVVIQRLGAKEQNVVLLHLLFATILLILAGLTILVYRKKISNYILSPSHDRSESAGWGQRQLASVWHILALLYLVLLWALLVAAMANPEHYSSGAFLLSFFVIPVWLLADRLCQWVVLYTMSTLKIHQTHYQDSQNSRGGELEDETLQAARQKGKEYYLRVKRYARTGVVIAIAVWLASLWSIEIPYISRFAAALLDGLIIMTLALIFWRFLNSWIEKKIAESTPEEDDQEDTDDEWGAAATRGRSYTLLPMVRKFVATVLVVMVTMTILSSFGVNIGPLLAGAGVVGLAVGFGAQKLVADMFSGFFYLLDDAFRVGEYLTAGAVSGTVESITLRNVMLRHHRGMLQIVPHSELGAITNYMRGGIIVKFNLDFPYEANIDKIRKIIKKVGIAMLEDEEFGKDFIRPVKSQGVREISNSVMTIRVKFTAQPGAHFVIRREAYKRITEALNKNNIYYAHKKVIVDVPGFNSQEEGELSHAPHKAISNVAGGAALAALEEEEQQGQQTQER